MIPTLGCVVGEAPGSRVAHPNPAWDEGPGAGGEAGEGERAEGRRQLKVGKRQAAFSFERGEGVSAVRGSQEEEIKHLMGQSSAKT